LNTKKRRLLPGLEKAVTRTEGKAAAAAGGGGVNGGAGGSLGCLRLMGLKIVGSMGGSRREEGVPRQVVGRFGDLAQRREKERNSCFLKSFYGKGREKTPQAHRRVILRKERSLLYWDRPGKVHLKKVFFNDKATVCR